MNDKKKAMGLWLVLLAGSGLLAACGEGGGGGGGGGGEVTYNLQCSGTYSGYPATVTGARHYRPTTLLDGYVTFSGSITVPSLNETAPMNYEGYTYTAPFQGNINSATYGVVPIGVLDATGNSGDEMKIYLDVPSSGPPTILGQLLCVWS